MNCKEFERLIVLSLEGENTSRQENILQTHLEECAGCRKALEDYRDVRHLFSTLPLEPVPVLPAFKRFVPEKRKMAFPVLRRTILAPAALAVCLLLTIGIIKFRNASLSVPVPNSSGANLLAGVSEGEFFDVNFPNSTDYQYFIENLSVEEQETFFKILNEI
ncbi:MAG: zf-HC2 domain-containing protein [Candidatus Ratteibacteria bacterium]|jgi:predicted anti-sigma-YlaC factor YlaD